MAGKPLHFHPEKDRTFARAEVCARLLTRIVDRHHVRAVHFAPVVRLEHVDGERINPARRAADPIAVVLDHEEHGQLPLFGKTNRFEKIALTRCRVADCGDDDIFLSIQLNAPGHSACGQELRAGGCRHTPNVQIRIAVMGGHLPAAASGVALGEIFEAKLARRHAAPENKTTIPIIRNDVIFRLHEE